MTAKESPKEGRPAPRSRPRPAKDEDVDPVVTRTAKAAAPATAEPAGKARAATRSRVPTLQLNVAVTLDVLDMLEAATKATGRTRRDLVENAIREAYASYWSPPAAG